ncbi:amino acid synthesis family protein [Delftia sp. PS-11]|uniref:amino acid synthesis family protein n=1 Tax=Delftia sp. PS-11 TaxID=2767222 RepID=UPI0024543738|nr:amino acid synthesis family protein [Delftia sp. PS-11]KAJ8746410.1 amino acid synthesis family protein [Delftia sp. PS-11]
MSLIQIRRTALTLETVYHENGPAPAVPLRQGCALAVVRNPYAGRYEPDLLPFMSQLRELGRQLATELATALGTPNVEAYGKGAIVGVAGELEHAALWHEAGGWAVREVLGEPKAIVPASKAVAATGYRLMVPMHCIHAAYVRSHFNAMEMGLQDGPRPDEIVYGLVMATGGRIHSRIGGLSIDNISVHDGQR